MSRATGFFVLLLVGIAVVLALLPRERRHAESATIAQSVRLYGYNNDGTSQWEIRADDGRIDEAEQTLSGIAVTFYAEDGSTLSVRANRLERTNAVSRLTGNVRIERPDDLLLQVDLLTWDEAANRLESGPIDLSTEELSLSAAQFEYDLDSESASFSGDVEALATLETEWTIHADRAEERDGFVTFRNNVDAESEDGKSFRCHQLRVDAESRTVHLSGDVRGEWSSGHLSAESVWLSEDGIRAVGRATARLDLEELRNQDDT
jgi:hypothetical protein